MRILLYILLICSTVTQVGLSQQDGLLTQFAYNKMSFNPAYASQLKYAELGILIRDQWNGIDGAPTTYQATGIIPITDYRLGLGVIANRENIGIQTTTNLRTMYSYSIPTDYGVLSAGIEASLRSYNINFNDDRLTAFETIEADPSLQGQQSNTYIFNTGIGLYFKNQKFYAGVSVPRLLNANYLSNPQAESAEVRHLYVMAGSIIELNESFELLPQAMFSLAPNSPYDLDLQVGLLYQKEYHLGLNYRVGGNRNSLGESVAILLGLQPIERFFIGFSYDITFSDLRLYETGSLEVMLTYTFGNNNPKEVLTNPRFF